MNESCPTYQSVMSHICMNRVTCINDSCPNAGRSVRTAGTGRLGVYGNVSVRKEAEYGCSLSLLHHGIRTSVSLSVSVSVFMCLCLCVCA